MTTLITRLLPPAPAPRSGPIPSIEGVAPVDLDAIGNITQIADVFLLSGGEFAVQSARTGSAISRPTL